MKTPADLSSARQRRAAADFAETLASARLQLHGIVDRIFDAAQDYAEAAKASGVAPSAAESRLVGVGEAAARLNLSEAALRTLADRGLVPCIRLPSTRGSRPIIRYDLDDLDAYLQSRKQTA